jgi:hypothetical protein
MMRFKTNEKIKALNSPNAYKPKNVMPCKLKIPKTLFEGMTNAINNVNTGILALQLINGATIIVINRSFQLVIVLLDIIPGMAHAALEINGTTLLPFNPKGRINLSMMKTTRAMYPVSSKSEIKKNNKQICGKKITTPPIPGKMP